MADPALGHHGDRDGALDFADLAYGRHPGDSPVAPDVRRNPLQRHDRSCPGLLGDLRAPRVHDDELGARAPRAIDVARADGMADAYRAEIGVESVALAVGPETAATTRT